MATTTTTTTADNGNEHGRAAGARSSKILHYYRKTEPIHSLLPSLREELKGAAAPAGGGGGGATASEALIDVETESCFNVSLLAEAREELTAEQTRKLEWLLSETFDPKGLALERSFFDDAPNAAGPNNAVVVEFGPRLAFTSAFSSNAVSICRACDLPVGRLELSRRYRFHFREGSPPSEEVLAIIKTSLHDRMTEQEYREPLKTFDSGIQPEPVKTVPIMEGGRSALEKINREMGLGFDEFDLDYYTHLFKVPSFYIIEDELQTCRIGLFDDALSMPPRSSHCVIVLLSYVDFYRKS